MSLLTVRIARRWLEATDILGLELVADDGAELPAFEAGAHLDVHLPGGLVRPYSLCSHPAQRQHYQLGVLLEPASRGGSRAVHTQLAEGQRLQVSPPKNHFALQPGAGPSLLLAGGIGITPILAMAEQLAAQDRPFSLHYAARSAERAAFVPRMQAAAWAPQLQLHLDDGPAAQRLDLAAVLAQPQADAQLYVCGPQGFIDAVLATARAAGWAEAQLHLERFGAAAPAAHDADEAFEVQLGQGGRVVLVPRGQTVVQALAAAGVEVPVSCEQGVCGTCLTSVLDGQPDHRDQYLTPEEQAACDQFLPCCSRARSARLVLAL